jgi:hypothetical protein
LPSVFDLTVRRRLGYGDAAAFERFMSDFALNAIAVTESQELTTEATGVLKLPALPVDEDANVGSSASAQRRELARVKEST